MCRQPHVAGWISPKFAQISLRAWTAYNALRSYAVSAILSDEAPTCDAPRMDVSSLNRSFRPKFDN